jgi:redox-sensitive bicupin YhaK (pirin superfamily)
MDSNSTASGIELVIVPPTHDLGGGFQVRRALPSTQQRMVGPFVFFDQMGPTVLRAGSGLDVRPHPHIGLATVTYLFDGEIIHRDSLGTTQAIRPGAVNWMIAGRGIVHSERTAADKRSAESALFGIQTWVALPRAAEECAPSFRHHAASVLPLVEAEGKTLRLIAGTLYGASSPAATLSPMFYADVALTSGAQLPVAGDYEQRAIYITHGRIEIDHIGFDAGQLLVLRPHRAVTVRADGTARVLLLGGEPLDGPRHVWWNFVSSSTDRIEQAKEDWRQGRLGTVPGDAEFIPLPSAPAMARSAAAPDSSDVRSRPVDYP